MGILLILIGAVTALVGLLVMLLERFGVPRLPGDILIQKGNVTFFFPIVTSILLSILLTVLLSLFKK